MRVSLRRAFLDYNRVYKCSAGERRMSDKVVLTIDLTREEHWQIEELPAISASY